jgi:hypothetical protein
MAVASSGYAVSNVAGAARRASWQRRSVRMPRFQQGGCLPGPRWPVCSVTPSWEPESSLSVAFPLWLQDPRVRMLSQNVRAGGVIGALQMDRVSVHWPMELLDR